MNTGHSGHCRACKERVRELLRAIYGGCHVDHSFGWPASPEAYSSTPLGQLLHDIRAALGGFRGHRGFIKSALVPPCDFVISDPPFIVEFDESQHFTRARLITLKNYPPNLPLGFSMARWQELCAKIDAEDNQPFDRDERRAWYDTLRDLIPPIHGFGATVRLYAEAQCWCALDPDRRSDRERFLASFGAAPNLPGAK